MSKPNSVVTRFRWFLAAVIEPKPALGEAWCVACSLNDGVTIALPASGAYRHARLHPPGEPVTITGWHRVTGERDG